MAAPTLQNIKNSIGAGARSNLFRVTYSGVNNATNLSILTKSAALPSSTLGMIEIPFRGRRLKVAGDRVFSEWTTTIINDQGFSARNAIETFQKKFNVSDYGTTASNTFQGDRNSERATLTVEQLNASNVSVRTYSLINCFPSEIGAIDLSYDTTDAIEEFTVTWTYDYFTTS